MSLMFPPGVSFRQQLAQPLNKVITIIIVIKNPAPFNATDNDMMEQIGAIDARLSWHIERITNLKH